MICKLDQEGTLLTNQLILLKILRLVMNEDVRRQTISIQNQIMIYIFPNDQFKQSTANEVGADNYEVRHAQSLLRFFSEHFSF